MLKCWMGLTCFVLMHKSSQQATHVPEATNITKQQHDMSPAPHLLQGKSNPLDFVDIISVHLGSLV